MELGFRDRNDEQGGDALPYDFSAATYSYLHQKAEPKKKDPSNQLFSPFRNVGSSVLNSKAPPRSQIDDDISQIKDMRNNMKQVVDPHRADQINQHISKVKSQPYFGQLYDPYDDSNPYDR